MSKALTLVQKYYPDVTSVVDAKRNVSVTIVKEDCVKGKKLQPSQCALARAFERVYDGAIISVSVAYLIRGRKAYRFRVPLSISREVIVFDRGQDFAPGDYQLLAPGDYHKLGNSQGSHAGKDKQRKEKIGPTKRYHHTQGIRSL